MRPPGCVVQYTRGTNVQNASYQCCEHPGFPGARVRRGSGGGQDHVGSGSRSVLFETNTINVLSKLPYIDR
eukprot:493798-Prorocentrum_minimum.AAC.1